MTLTCPLVAGRNDPLGREQNDLDDLVNQKRPMLRFLLSTSWPAGCTDHRQVSPFSVWLSGFPAMTALIQPEPSKPRRCEGQAVTLRSNSPTRAEPIRNMNYSQQNTHETFCVSAQNGSFSPLFAACYSELPPWTQRPCLSSASVGGDKNQLLGPASGDITKTSMTFHCSVGTFANNL